MIVCILPRVIFGLLFWVITDKQLADAVAVKGQKAASGREVVDITWQQEACINHMKPQVTDFTGGAGDLDKELRASNIGILANSSEINYQTAN